MSEKEDADFAVWVSEQQRSAAETEARDQVVAFERVRTRLSTLLPLTVTLTTASLAAAFSGKAYSSVASALSAGFFIAGALCLYGMRTEAEWRNIHLNTRDWGLLADTCGSDNKKARMNTLIAIHVSGCNEKNDLILRRNRKRLQRVLWALGLTLIAAPAVAYVAPHLWSGIADYWRILWRSK